MKRDQTKLWQLAIALCIGLLPVSASAATIYMTAAQKDVSVGDIIVIDVRANTEGASLNAIDGNISMTSNVAMILRDTSVSGSILNYWPAKPTISKDGKSVSFTGGTPNGFNSDSSDIFRLVVEAAKAGDVTFSPLNVNAYLNDGKGTKAPVKSESLTIHVMPKGSNANVNEWMKVIGTDTVQPEPFQIAIGQDPSLYSGKRYAYFSATDAQSGIDRYVVTEDGNSVTQTSNIYVLSDQDQNVPIKLSVVAYDKAGNARTSEYVPQAASQPVTTPWVLIAVIALLVIVALFAIVRRKK